MRRALRWCPPPTRSGSAQWPRRHPGWPAHAGRWAWPSSQGASLNALAQCVEIGGIGWCSRSGGCTFQQQATQMEPIRIFANQLTHVLTTSAVATLGDLLIHERFERVGKGNIHGTHEIILDGLAKFALNRKKRVPEQSKRSLINHLGVPLRVAAGRLANNDLHVPP